MANIKLTENFTIDELKCKDGTSVPWDLVDNAQELAEELQILRDYLGEPIHITSGYRNPTYNKMIGGEDGSFHCKAMAADITVASKTPKELYNIVEKLIKQGKLRFGGVGLYKNFIHVDTRNTKARW